MFKVVLDPRETYVGVAVFCAHDAMQFCRAAAEVVSGASSFDQVNAELRRIYEGYAKQMSDDLNACWDRKLWDYVIDTPVGPHIKVSATFGVLVLSKLGII